MKGCGILGVFGVFGDYGEFGEFGEDVPAIPTIPAIPAIPAILSPPPIKKPPKNLLLVAVFRIFVRIIMFCTYARISPGGVRQAEQEDTKRYKILDITHLKTIKL